jgi:hypothetical protein
LKITRRSVAYSVCVIDALLFLAMAGLASINLLFAGDPLGGVSRAENEFVTLALVTIAVLFARAAWFAIRREWRPLWQAAPLLGFAALFVWQTAAAKSRERHVENYDRHLLSAIIRVRPRLPALAAALELPSGAAGFSRCDASLVAEFPTCIRDGRRVLLLAVPSPEADYLHPVEGLAYNPTGEPTEFIGGWYIGALLEPLGAGSYHVRGYPGLD